jgi:hypothetical protein
MASMKLTMAVLQSLLITFVSISGNAVRSNERVRVAGQVPAEHLPLHWYSLSSTGHYLTAFVNPPGPSSAIVLYDVKKGVIQDVVRQTPSIRHAYVLGNDSGTVIAAHYGRPYLWRRIDSGTFAPIEIAYKQIAALAMDSVGTICAGIDDSGVFILDTKSGSVRRPMPAISEVRDLCVSANGQRFAVMQAKVDEAVRIIVYDMGAFQVDFTAPVPPPFESGNLAMSDDGSVVSLGGVVDAYGGNPGRSFYVWRIDAPDKVRHIHFDATDIHSKHALSHDGALLICRRLGGAGGWVLRVYDAATTKLLSELTDEELSPSSSTWFPEVAFDEQNKNVIIAGPDGVVREWKLPAK